MTFEGFRPEDFLYFLDDDRLTVVEYVRDSLHPRLRDFGHDLAAGLRESLGVELRPQLRSGRWYKNPWGTWTSLILPREKVRSDNRRPRLCVFIDEHECLVGFMQNVWRERWKRLVKQRRADLIRTIDKASSGRPKLHLALVHWIRYEGETYERETLRFKTAAELLEAADELGQDFVCVGRVYPFPPEADRLTSPDFATDALKVLKKAWPVYSYAFEQTAGE